MDKGLQGQNRSNGPQFLAFERLIARDRHTRTHVPVLNRDFVIVSSLSKAFDAYSEEVAALHLLTVSDGFAIHRAERRVHGLGRMYFERQGDGEIRSDWLVIEDQEVVIVDAAYDRSPSDIHEAVLHHHLRLSGNQANGLLIEVTVA